jgi:hypothetical protein
MSAVLNPPLSTPNLVRHVLQSWRSLTWQEGAAFGLAGLLFGLLELTSLAELKTSESIWGTVALHLTVNLLACTVFVLCWLPVTRSDDHHPHRRWRLLAATLFGSMLSVAAVRPVMDALPWHSVCDLYAMSKGRAPCSIYLWTDWLGDTIWIGMQALLLVAVFEAWHQRRRHERLAHDLVLEHGQLKRRALGARLAALQAQVEPELLFKSLIAIQQAYAEGDAAAGQRIERLIHHLRLALPRLRDAGARLDAEAELVRSYLDVIGDLRGQPVRFESDGVASQATACLPPMLLLPLVQRALRLAQPEHAWLRAWRASGGLRLCLGFDREGLCAEDAELNQLRERLGVLDIRLVCHSDAQGTEFTLEMSA